MPANKLDGLEKKVTKSSKLGKIAQLLDENGVDLEEVGSINRVNIRQTIDKGEVVDLASISFAPSWDSGPAWPVVQQAKPCRPRKSGVSPASTDGFETAVILPDPQIGYRVKSDGTLAPFHDEAAMSVALRIAKSVRPHQIINLGDYLDLPAMSKYRQEQAFAHTTQAAIDRGHEFLAQQREITDRIVVLEGNHDARLRYYINDNARAAFGLKRAQKTEEWPVMSVPYLMRFEELGVEYVEGYPSGYYQVNDNLICIHGVYTQPDKTISEENVSTFQGHLHRFFHKEKTTRTAKGAFTRGVYSPGCLCRVDGSVPSMRSGTTSDGSVTPTVEDWQQGIAVVHYEPEGEQRYFVDMIRIKDGTAIYRGKVYRG